MVTPFMDELRELIESSRDGSKKNDVMDAINYLVEKNLEEVFTVLKDIFFHPLTNREIRMEIGKIIAATKNQQVYNLLISYLILRNFSDLGSVVYTLGEYKNPEIYDILVREYNSCNFETQLEIITAISKIQSVKAIEFFSKVFNGEIPSANLTNEQMQQLKTRAGDALQQVIDI
jgi:hypothetical protein